MTPADATFDWAAVDAICHDALPLAREDRARFIAVQCAGSRSLRAEVEAWLAAAERTHGFLERQPLDDLTARVGEGDALLAAGTMVGAWRIERALGAGGMGRVYLATRRTLGVEQRAALKVIRGHRFDLARRQHFEREAAVLARVRHPHITTLLDAGTMPDGAPYLVMPYVEGEAIVPWVRRHACRVADRVRLIRTVATAVAHAHQRLIVHRDLKPSNVLVDEEGHPHLIDFGIARLLGAAEETAPGGAARVGTPAYSSPEQLCGAPIGVATDVHGLGVLLFEVLTGVSPWRTPGALPVPARICAGVAPRASDLIADRAARRHVRGDLDAIIARAMAPEPESRYASVEQFIDDLDRLGAGMPVAARALGRPARALRMLRRHRISIGLLLLTFAALTAATAISAASAVRVARAAERRAAERDDARAVIGVLQHVLETTDPLAADHAPTLASVLAAAETEVIALPATRPRVRGRLHLMLARTYETLAQWPAARRHAEHAVASFRSLPASAITAAEEAECLEVLGTALTECAWIDDASYARAVRVLREATRRREAVGDEVATARTQCALAQAVELHDPTGAGVQEACALREDAITRLHAAPERDHAVLARAWSGLAPLRARQHDRAAAEVAYRTALAHAAQALRISLRERLHIEAGLADLLYATGARDEARQRYTRILDATPASARRWRTALIAWQLALDASADAPAGAAALRRAMEVEADVIAATLDPTRAASWRAAAATSDAALAFLETSLAAAGSSDATPPAPTAPAHRAIIRAWRARAE